MTVHMLRSVGDDKKLGRPMIEARCGTKRPHRKTDGVPDDFTGWERDVTCPRCVLPGEIGATG